MWSTSTNLFTPIMKIDITQDKKLIDAINTILNRGGIVEIKLEGHNYPKKIVVIDISRKVVYR